MRPMPHPKGESNESIDKPEGCDGSRQRVRINVLTYVTSDALLRNEASGVI